MAEYVNIRIRKDTYERLKELSAGVPLVQYLDEMCRRRDNKQDEADKLLEELDAKSDNYVNPLLEGLDPDELPECCQDFLKSQGSKNCGHWEDRRPRGYYNTLTHKYASDPDYYQYL